MTIQRRGPPRGELHSCEISRAVPRSLPTWATVLSYYFERDSVIRHGLPADREHLRPYLVPAGAPPRPRFEVENLPQYRPREVLAHHKPTVEGLVGFGTECSADRFCSDSDRDCGV